MKINKSVLTAALAGLFSLDFFPQAVGTYVDELNEWREHMLRVESDKNAVEAAPARDAFDSPSDYVAAQKDWQARTDQLHQPYPKPFPPLPLFEQFVDVDAAGAYVASIEIINDDPTPEQLLVARKARLTLQIQEDETRAIEAAMPANKVRYLTMRKNGIDALDAMALKDLALRVQDESLKLAAMQVAFSQEKDEEARASAAADIVAQSKVFEDVMKTHREPWEYLRSLRSDHDNALVDDVAARNDAVNEIRRKVAEMLYEVDDLTVETVDAFQIRQL